MHESLVTEGGRFASLADGPASRSIERSVIVIFAGIRSITLVQAWAGMAAGSLHVMDRAWLDITALVMVTLESAVLLEALRRRRSATGAKALLMLDTAAAIGVVAATAGYVDPRLALANWVGWAFPVTLATAALGGVVLQRWWQVTLLSLVLGVTYLLVFFVPLAGRDLVEASTAAANFFAYPGYAISTWLICRSVRGVARRADDAQARVAELERDRSRAMAHDVLGYLRLDRLLEADASMRETLVLQATRKRAELRAFVDATDEFGDVAGAVRRVVDLHLTLRLTLDVRLTGPVVLPEDLVRSTAQALDTALINVAQNAPLAAVRVSVKGQGEEIVVTISDDGPGFVPEAIVPGFGLTQTLGRNLRAVGGSASVRSVPGQGTRVEIRLPRAER